VAQDEEGMSAKEPPGARAHGRFFSILRKKFFIICTISGAKIPLLGAVLNGINNLAVYWFINKIGPCTRELLTKTTILRRLPIGPSFSRTPIAGQL
jgi:ABC-type lipoprotein release transport system permease subunit